MFLSVLPDIDIVLRLAGLDLGHRTITHSAIIWLVLGTGVILFTFLTLKYRKGMVLALYFTAYLSHIVIGDIIVGPINILYPVGGFVIYSPIKGVDLFFLEAIVFSIMAAVVMTKYYSFRKRKENIFLFRYHSRADTILYPVLVLALTSSFFYVLANFNLSFYETAIVAPLHLAAIFTIFLMWRVSKKTLLSYNEML
jgi:membrane-bound metal-dependent hydrolase YbcI (DUF457 family)